MADVFVSYASEDRERVRSVVEAIEKAGYSVWWDRHIGLGRSFDREIERELAASACVVVVWSKASIESDWVRDEAQEGIDRGILVPALLDEVRQPLGFRRIQAAHVHRGDDRELTRLLEAIDSVMARANPDQRRVAGFDQTKNGSRIDSPLSAIAVVPFDDLSPKEDLRWLSEGLAEDLIDSLSRIEDLRVPARNSTSAMKDQKASVEEIGDRLAVGSIITGSVRQVGDQILVAVQWIRIEDQTPMWSARYERSLENVLAIQREIASGISEAIRTELGIHDTAEFVSKDRYQTSDVRAWAAYRNGFTLVAAFRPEEVRAGREYLQQAIEIDPHYLEAHAWLAYSDFDRPTQRAESAIRVLEQQPGNPVALCALIEDSESQWDFATAEVLWRFAVANNPLNNLLTLAGFHLCSCLGALDEAFEVARRGARLDPLWPTQQFFLGLAHLNLADPTAAIEPITKAATLLEQTGGGNTAWFYRYLAFAYQMLGKEADAVGALCKGFPRYRQEVSEAAEKGGLRAANSFLASAHEDLREDHLSQSARSAMLCLKASVLAAAGERDSMYARLTELMQASAEFDVRDRDALRTSQQLPKYLRSNAEFQPYWQEAEFQSLKLRLDDRMAEAAGTSGYADLVG